MWSGLFEIRSPDDDPEGPAQCTYLFGEPFEVNDDQKWVGRIAIRVLPIDGCIGMAPPSDANAMVLHADGRWYQVMVQWARAEDVDTDHLVRLSAPSDDRMSSAEMESLLERYGVPKVLYAAGVGLMAL